jgi:pimeloyl-ACP methyl ester carboxylesterase
MSESPDIPTVVLAHGGFADASFWAPVITYLQAAIAVRYPSLGGQPPRPRLPAAKGPSSKPRLKLHPAPELLQVVRTQARLPGKRPGR